VSPKVNPPEPPPEPLPRGRHKLSRRFVRNSQRSRLIQAVWEAVADKGYASATVSDVVSRARVSRNAFYEFFADKEDCFLAACDENNVELLRLLYAPAAAPTWQEALRDGLGQYLRWWQERPGIAVAYLIDLPTAGRRAIEQRDRTYEQFGQMFEALAARAREEQDGLPPLSRLSVWMLVSGLTELIGHEVRGGRLDKLNELEDELMLQIVRTLADERTAAALQ
jgi:AcrR family transcriptional regulator